MNLLNKNCYHLHGNSGMINRVYHLYKSVPITKKPPRKSEACLKLVLKISFNKLMVLEFSLGTCRPEKQDYLFRFSVAAVNFLLEQVKKSYAI